MLRTDLIRYSCPRCQFVKEFTTPQAEELDQPQECPACGYPKAGLLGENYWSSTTMEEVQEPECG